MSADNWNPEIAQLQIAKIKEHMGDNEQAHMQEDLSRTRFLLALVAGTVENIPECARILLTSEDLDFER